MQCQTAFATQRIVDSQLNYSFGYQRAYEQQQQESKQVSGPVFDESQSVRRINGTGIPAATYKVISWLDGAGVVHARGYIIGMNDTDSDLHNYLKSIDEVEAATGLDFSKDLDDANENALEDDVPTTLWE